MLCDIALATLQRAAEVTRRRLVPSAGLETDKGIDTLVRSVRHAQRFVLSPLFVETAIQLAEPRAIERSRDHLFTPADLTWLEWTGAAPGGHPASHRHALLLIGHGAGDDRTSDTILLGWGAYFAVNPSGDPFPLIFSYDFRSSGRPILSWQQSPLVMSATVPDGRDWAFAIDHRRLGAFLGGTLALINTPRIAHVIDHDHSVLNRSRLRLKRPPVLSYKEVRITVDRGALGHGNIGTSTEGRALHHVRAFLRIVRGRVQLVSPHWRGNPRFGVVVHRYVALREEDEPGPWQGGSMPPPSVIKDLDDRTQDEIDDAAAATGVTRDVGFDRI